MTGERPICPVCKGSLKRVSVGGETPCTNCVGGFMRGIDDFTDEEIRVMQLEEQLQVERARAAALEQLAMGAAFEWGRAYERGEKIAGRLVKLELERFAGWIRGAA